MNVVRWLCMALVLSAGVLACGGDGLGLVQDGAGLLTEAQRRELEIHHQYLLLDHDIDYRVVTSSSGGSIDLAALELFESLSAGARSSHGRGLLLLLDSELQQVRLEVGFALEGTFPDAFVAYLEQRQMVPFFVENRISDGILASTELIIDRAQRASRNAGWDDEIWMEGSGGAGAQSSTRTAPGFTTRPAAQSAIAVAAATRSPEEVVAIYLDAMARRDNSPELDIYTPETQAMMRGWLVTPAQMDQVARNYAGCNREELRYSNSRDRAVIRYPIAQRHCAPWFLERRGQGWQLDLTMQHKVIRFGRSNAWHFDVSRPHPYGFAFEDWVLDGNGFPIESRAED